MTDRYLARSASDRTEKWPFWFIADGYRGGSNVTAEILRTHVDPTLFGIVFLPRLIAEYLAQIANGAGRADG